MRNSTFPTTVTSTEHDRPLIDPDLPQTISHQQQSTLDRFLKSRTELPFTGHGFVPDVLAEPPHDQSSTIIDLQSAVQVLQ